MTKKEATVFDKYVEEQKVKAQDGSQILADIEPELPWVDVKDLVGQRILLMSMEEDEPKYGERKIRVTCGSESDNAFRFSSEHMALIRNIDALEPYFPVWVVVEMSASKQGREYFHLQKQEGEASQDEIPF